MRLIDADALFDKALNVWGTEADAGETNLFMDMINNAPTITPPPNDPLTLEELREMDGPVWCFVPDCDWIPERGYWCLCQHGEIVAPSGNRFEYADIPDWIFYRRKPEEVTM